MSHPFAMPHDLPSADTIVFRGAGVVLATPYLLRLWTMLGLVLEHGNPDAERAAHLMHFLAFGEQEPDGHTSALDRLLCGLPLARPSDAPVSPSATERQAIDGLLGAMITHWTALGQTSVEGLRNTFLQREGSLVQGEGCWQLYVTPSAVDYLLDRLPWRFAKCKFPWMPQPLSVLWR